MRNLKMDKSDLFGAFVSDLLFSMIPLLLATLPLMAQGQKVNRKALEQQLTQELVGSVINLPTPLSVARLRFDHDGSIIGDLSLNSTLYKYFEIEKIKVKKNRYEIRGYPVCIDPDYAGPEPKFYRVLSRKRVDLATTPESTSAVDFQESLAHALRWAGPIELPPRPVKSANQAADKILSNPNNEDGSVFTGKIELQTMVDEEGHVRDIEILKSAGCHIDLVAIKKVETFTYKPTRYRGKAIAVPTQITIVFKSQ